MTAFRTTLHLSSPAIFTRPHPPTLDALLYAVLYRRHRGDMNEARRRIPLRRSGDPEHPVFHGSAPLIHVYPGTVLRTHASRALVGGARPQDFLQFPEVSWQNQFQTARNDTCTVMGAYPVLWVEPQIPSRSLAALPPLSLTYFGASDDLDQVQDLLSCAMGVGKKTRQGFGTIDRIEDIVALDQDASLVRNEQVMRPLPEPLAGELGLSDELQVEEASFEPPYGFTPKTRCVLPPILPLLREELL